MNDYQKQSAVDRMSAFIEKNWAKLVEDALEESGKTEEYDFPEYYAMVKPYLIKDVFVKVEGVGISTSHVESPSLKEIRKVLHKLEYEYKYKFPIIHFYEDGSGGIEAGSMGEEVELFDFNDIKDVLGIFDAWELEQLPDPTADRHMEVNIELDVSVSNQLDAEQVEEKVREVLTDLAVSDLIFSWGAEVKVIREEKTGE